MFVSCQTDLFRGTDLTRMRQKMATGWLFHPGVKNFNAQIFVWSVLVNFRRIWINSGPQKISANICMWKKQDIFPHETQPGTYHFEATVIMTDG